MNDESSDFEWDEEKNLANIAKHQVDFLLAQRAFADAKRVFAEDELRREQEKRYYCFGEVDGRVMTVRFTMRESKVRMIGAGYWQRKDSL